MKSREKKDVQIILILNQFEAQWLKDVVQNPLNATGNPELESPRDAEIRRVFWDELSKYDLSYFNPDGSLLAVAHNASP